MLLAAPPLPPGSVLHEGQYGPFEGSLQDQVVMHEYRTLGTWATGIVSLMQERLFAAGGGTLIDVGANLGLVVVPVVERTGALGIAFEPEPRNFAYLARNVARHGLSERIELHASACYSEATRLPLLLSETNLGDHRLQPRRAQRESPAQRTVEVPAVRLDDVLRDRELPHPIVLKVDAQGSEVCVFEGALETLSRVDFVITEYWPEGIVAHGQRTERFHELMRSFEFGGVLNVAPLPEPLHNSSYALSQLDWVKQDGSDPGFFDLLFSRHWVLPGHGPEMDALVAAIEQEKRRQRA
jgi:FkbM family methyltransferase